MDEVALEELLNGTTDNAYIEVVSYIYNVNFGFSYDFVSLIHAVSICS
jgi:hypothetical protein